MYGTTKRNRPARESVISRCHFAGTHWFDRRTDIVGEKVRSAPVPVQENGEPAKHDDYRTKAGRKVLEPGRKGSAHGQTVSRNALRFESLSHSSRCKGDGRPSVQGGQGGQVLEPSKGSSCTTTSSTWNERQSSTPSSVTTASSCLNRTHSGRTARRPTKQHRRKSKAHPAC